MSVSLRMENVLKSLDKAYSGEICTAKDWDIKVIPQAVKSKLKKYNLEKTYDPNNPINSDDELADRFWKAGRELALELGLLCEDTERIIKVTEEEIQEALENYPTQIIYGAGDDQVIMKPRKPEDPYPPVLVAPLALMVSEENYVPILAGTAKKRKLVDVLNGLSFENYKGRKVRSGTPYETFLGHYEQELKRQALWLADREEMGTCGVGNSTTEYGHLGGAPATPGKNPTTMCLLPAEMKVTFANFHRTIQALNYGQRIHAGSSSYIGGYAGGVEGAILCCIANELLQITILQIDNTNNNVFDMKYLGGSGSKALWGNTVATQAVARNSRIMTDRIIDTVGGPCTEFYMYEAACSYMAVSVSGACKTIAPRSAGGRFVDYITPVEAWWCGQVFKSCAGMSRKEANAIALKLLPKYEGEIANPPKGKSFRECFDVVNMEPSEEYKALYKRIENELIEMGMPLKKVFEL
jgi:methylamine--corrinoid protein Co-methyltransferase